MPLPGPALLPALLGGLVASGLAILSGRSQGATPTSGSLAPGLDYHFDPAAPGGARVTLTRPDPATGVPQPDAELTANAQGALTTADGAVVGRLREGSFEIDVNALLAAHPPAPAAPPGMAPAPVLPGLEGVTPAAPGVAGPLPGLTARAGCRSPAGSHAS